MYNLILDQENIKGELIDSSIDNLPTKYDTGLNQFNDFEVKDEWKVKEYSEDEKVELFDRHRPSANASYMDKVEGFVRIYKNPHDDVLIIQNGMGLSSSIQSFAIKIK